MYYKGKPHQNGYMARFNRSFREEVLDAYQFGMWMKLFSASDTSRNAQRRQTSETKFIRNTAYPKTDDIM